MDVRKHFRNLVKSPEDLKALEQLVQEYRPFLCGLQRYQYKDSGKMCYIVTLRYKIDATHRTAVARIEDGKIEILMDESDEDIDFIEHEIEGKLRRYLEMEFTYKDEIWRFSMSIRRRPGDNSGKTTPSEREILRALAQVRYGSLFGSQRRKRQIYEEYWWKACDINLLDREDRIFYPHMYYIILEITEGGGARAYFFAYPAGECSRDRIARAWTLGPKGRFVGLDRCNDPIYNERFTSEMMRILPTLKVSNKYFYDAGFTIQDGRINFPNSEGGSFDPQNSRHIEWAVAIGFLRGLTMDTRLRRGPWRESFARAGVDYDDLIILDESKGPLPPLPPPKKRKEWYEI